MKLDITPLERALEQLEEGLRILDAKAWGDDEAQKRSHERGTVQAFEFTYGAAVGLLKRQMGQGVLDPDRVNTMDFKDFLRASADAGLIPDAVRFVDYREKRNLTSHIYHEENAHEVLAVLDDFVADMRFFLTQLQERNR